MMNPYEIERRILVLEKSFKDLKKDTLDKVVPLLTDMATLKTDVKKLGIKSKTS